MSGAATIFNSGGGIVSGSGPGGVPQQILSDGQALRTSMAAEKTVPGDSLIKVASQQLVGVSGDAALAFSSLRFNGLTFDAAENNKSVMLLASAVRGGTTVSPVFYARNARSVVIVILVTSDPGGGSTLQGVLRSTFPGGPVPLHMVVSAAVSPLNGGMLLLAGPGVNSDWGALYTQARIAAPIAPAMDVVISHSDVAPWTYSVAAMIME